MQRFVNCILGEVDKSIKSMNPFPPTRNTIELDPSQLRAQGQVKTIFNSIFPTEFNGQTATTKYVYLSTSSGFLLVFGDFYGDFSNEVSDDTGAMINPVVITTLGQRDVPLGFISQYGIPIDEKLRGKVSQMSRQSSISLASFTAGLSDISLAMPTTDAPTDISQSLDTVAEPITDTSSMTGTPIEAMNEQPVKEEPYVPIGPKVVALKGTWKESAVQFYFVDETTLIPLLDQSVDVLSFESFDLELSQNAARTVNIEQDFYEVKYNHDEILLTILAHGPKCQMLRNVNRDKQIERNTYINKLRVELNILARCEQFFSSNDSVTNKRMDANTFRLYLPKSDYHPHSRKLIARVHSKVHLASDKKKFFVDTVQKVASLVAEKYKAIVDMKLRQESKKTELEKLHTVCTDYLKTPTDSFPFSATDKSIQDNDILNIINPVLEILSSTTNIQDDVKVIQSHTEEYLASLQAKFKTLDDDVKKLENGAAVDIVTIFPLASPHTVIAIRRQTPLLANELYHLRTKTIFPVLLAILKNKQVVELGSNNSWNGIMDTGLKLLEKIGAWIMDNPMELTSSFKKEEFDKEMALKRSAPFWDRYRWLLEEIVKYNAFFEYSLQYPFAKEMCVWLTNLMDFMNKSLHQSGRMTVPLEVALNGYKESDEFMGRSIDDDNLEFIVKRFVTGEKFALAVSKFPAEQAKSMTDGLLILQ